VLNDDRLVPSFPEFLAHDARDDVDAGARRERNDDGDWPIGELLRKGDVLRQRQQGENGECANDSCQHGRIPVWLTRRARRTATLIWFLRLKRKCCWPCHGSQGPIFESRSGSVATRDQTRRPRR